MGSPRHLPGRDGRPAGGGVRRGVARPRSRAPGVHGASWVREGPVEGLRQDVRLARRAVPLRAKVVAALEGMPQRRGILFPAREGGRVDINNWRYRSWTPSLKAAGIAHRRIYDLRHTYASWSLAAGVDTSRWPGGWARA